jgi:hypothetical protein
MYSVKRAVARLTAAFLRFSQVSDDRAVDADGESV